MMMRRSISLILALVMVVSMVPVSVFASEGCANHPVHEGCSYREAVGEQVCDHTAHDESCETEQTVCVHTACDESCTEASEDGQTQCAHQCSWETGCVTVVIDCSHKEDGSCCYVPAQAAVDCDHSCEQCSGEEDAQDSGIQAAQALIDALPDPEKVTAADRDALDDDLNAIVQAVAAVPDGDRGKLDMVRYNAIVEKLEGPQGEPQTAMQINVFMASSTIPGIGSAYPLEVEITDSIETVKAKIQDELGYASGIQVLTYDGTKLENGNTLQDYGIQANSTIQLTTEAAPVTVTFDANGGSVTPASAATTTEGKLETLPVPTKEGRIFEGWVTDLDSMNWVNSGEVVNYTAFTEDTTIYAVWSVPTTVSIIWVGDTPEMRPDSIGMKWTTPDGLGWGDAITEQNWTVTFGLYEHKNYAFSVSLPDSHKDLYTVSYDGYAVTLTYVQESEAPGSPAVTRAQWLQQLVQTCGIEVESGENMPQDYFADLSSDSEYYRDMLLAVEFGVVNIPAGGELKPEESATREFAAQTLNFCLGFQFEGTDYTFSDADQCLYPNDDQIAVNRGWFALVEGAFCPNLPITEAERDVMLEDAREVLAPQTPPSVETGGFEFYDHVVVFPQGSNVNVSGGTVTINAGDRKVKPGDVFVVYPEGLPVLYIAEQVITEDNCQIVTAREAAEAGNLKSVNAKGQAKLNLSNFVPAADVSIASSSDAMRLEKKLKLGDALEVTIICDLKNVVMDYELNSISQKYYVRVGGDVDLYCNLDVDAVEAQMIPDEVSLGSLRTPGAGELALALTLGVEGETNINFSGTVGGGVEYDAGEFRVVKVFKKQIFTCTLESDTSVGVKASMGVDVLATEGTIFFETGIKAESETQDNGEGTTPRKCTDIDGWLYFDVGVEVAIGVEPFKKDWDETHSLYTKENSPVTVAFHWEDGMLADSCTKDDFYWIPEFQDAGPVYNESDFSVRCQYPEDNPDDPNDYPLVVYYVNAYGEAVIGNLHCSLGPGISIPSVIGGHPVVGIGKIGTCTQAQPHSCSQNLRITAISIPESVVFLGNGAFSNLRNLQTVSIPDSVRRINGYAFENTAITSIDWPSGATQIHYGTFMNCKSLQSINIPDTVTDIGWRAFDGTALTSLTLPANINYIGTDFISGTAIKELVLPKTAALDMGALRGSNLETLIFEEGTEIIQQQLIFRGVPGQDAVFNTTLTNVVIPETVTTIRTEAFRGFKALQTIDLPNSVEKIGGGAFADTGLTSFRVPDGVRTMGGYTFEGSDKLKEIHVSRNFVKLVNSLNESSVEKLVIEEGRWEIPKQFAQGVSELKEVVLPESVTSIGANAFANCLSLESITIPRAVTSIADLAFMNCPKLTEIRFQGNAPAFWGGTMQFDMVTATAYYPRSASGWTQEVMKGYGGDITWVAYGEGEETRNPVGNLSSGQKIEIDGETYVADENGVVWLEGTGDRVVTVFSSGKSSEEDPLGEEAHQLYPTSMEVSLLVYDAATGAYTMEKIEELSNFLTYKGTSIRMTGNQGIRIFTEVNEAKRAALIDGSLLKGTALEGYRLVEYGTLFKFGTLETADLVYDANVTGNRSIAFGDGRDAVFMRQNGEIWFTGMLVNLKPDLCDDELLLRPYMVLENEAGKQTVIHGGTLQRNIGYVAYQNRTYRPNQAAEDFIWNIIETVYGDKVQKSEESQ